MRGIEQYLQVDAATLGALKYQGTWDASTNTPTLTSSVGVQGQYYVVSVAGSTNLNGETNWQVGDWAVFNGSVWQKVDGGSTGLLTTLTVTGNTYLATTSGNVGIGTSSPVNNSGYGGLTLNGASGAIISMLENGSETFRVTNATGYSFVNTTGSTPLLIGTNATEAMRITSAGDVGIGTSSPGARLDVRIGGSGQATPAALFFSNNDGFTPQSLVGLAIYNNRTSGFLDTNLVFGNSANSYFAIGHHNGTSYAERMRLDSSGNLGLGVTPSASNLASFQSPYGMFIGNNEAHTTKNAYYSSGWKYVTTAVAARFAVGEGGSDFRWYNAASGTAGNAISFTQAMTLDASGNLGIGTTSEPFARGYSKWLAVSGSTTAAIEINAATGNIAYFDMGVNGTRSFSIINDGVAPSIAAVGALPLLFSTNSVERARIDSSGNWMAGTTTAIGRATVVGGSSQLSFHDGNGSNTNYGYLNYGGSSGELTLNANSTGGNTAIRFLTSNGGANAERVRIDYAGSLGLGGSSFGSGALVMFIANATTAPTTNPTGGGVLYVEAGALKYRGSSGTVTTIANA